MAAGNAIKAQASSAHETPDIYFDKKFDCSARRVRPGEYAVCEKDQKMLVTILGSCVAACIRDPLLGIGGMNHFLLPEAGDNKSGSFADVGTRYGNHAMELLINDMLKLGGKKDRFELKIFGGAHVGNMNVSIGADNSSFIRDYISREGLNLVSEDLGGNRARKIFFFPETGRVARFLFQATSDSKVSQRERELRKSIKTPKVESDIELFD